MPVRTLITHTNSCGENIQASLNVLAVSVFSGDRWWNHALTGVLVTIIVLLFMYLTERLRRK